MKDREGRMITRQEAAAMLRVEPQTVTNWINKGVLRGKTVGRITMVDGDTITKLFDSLEELADSEKAIKELLEKSYEQERELKRANEEWLKDAAMVNGLEKPIRLIRMIHSMIDNLGIMNDNERVILKNYFDGSDFEWIASNFGITRERTRQIIEKAIRKLGVLEPYGDVVSRRNELESANKTLKDMLEAQSAELAELREKLKITVADEKARNGVSEKDRAVYEALNIKLFDLNLSVRVLHCLKSADLETFGDLVKCQKIDIYKCRNFGMKSLAELDDLLEAMSKSVGVRFYFGMDVAPYYEKYRLGLIENKE